MLPASSMKFLCIFLTFLLLHCQQLTSPPKIDKGILDLSTQNLNKEEKEWFLLEGEMEFYWRQLYQSHKDIAPQTTHYIKVPAVWNGFYLAEQQVPSFGYASYRFVIKLPSPQKRLFSFKLRDQAHAYKLFIDGRLIKEWGKVGTNATETIPVMKTDIVSFNNRSDEIEVVFQVANFHHRVGGLRYNIWFGLEKHIRKEQDLIITLDSFIFGGIFLISIYHFAIFLFRRENLSSIFFAFFCLSVLIYVMETGERLLYYFFPAFNHWESNYKFEFILLSLVPTFLVAFFINLFSQFYKGFFKRAFSLHLLVNFCFIIFVLLVHPRIFTEYLFILDLDRILIGICVIYYMIKAVLAKIEGSFLFSFGFLILFLCSFNDVLVARSVLNSPQLSKFGLSLMILMQAILLAKVFTKDFQKAESLSNSLSNTNQTFSKFVPTEFLKLLNKNSILEVELGDQIQKKMTILFSDIRAFTSLSEKMSPSENFTFLNSYLSQIAPIIKENNGFIDKFIGDAIMGLFPSPDDAVQASILIQKKVSEINTIREELNSDPIKVGIGMHTGDLILGTIGHDERMESTVISDSVNLASRIEGLTKFYGSKILISESTFSELNEPIAYTYRVLDNVIVKGKMNSIAVVEILDGFSENQLVKFSRNKNDFETACILYKQQEFTASIKIFKKVLEKNPDDTACAFYLKRSEYYKQNGTPPEWEGVERFLDK
ncbi:MAG: adenylate/guanylate cyclase domain-containing protein [Spirochaetota bacterium]